jgi:hypothetical protein
MDRYFRRGCELVQQVNRVTVSIHLLWTGTLEVKTEFVSEEEKEQFQSIFYGQVL